MAVLTDPVNERNIISRFQDYTYSNWQGVTWGKNNLPTYAPGTGYATVVIPFGAMGGNNYDNPNYPPNDPFIGKMDGNPAGVGDQIIAERIHNYLNYFTTLHLKIRSVRVRLFVNGTGGNNGSKPAPGFVFDETAVAYLSFSTVQPGLNDYLAPARGAVDTNLEISTYSMENFMERCRTAYQNYARNQTFLYEDTVCHASCHTSCHESRGRR